MEKQDFDKMLADIKTRARKLDKEKADLIKNYVKDNAYLKAGDVVDLECTYYAIPRCHKAKVTSVVYCELYDTFSYNLAECSDNGRILRDPYYFTFYDTSIERRKRDDDGHISISVNTSAKV